MSVFKGVKIIDLTRVFSGPFATRHFADYGANVIKIEPPNGDDARYFPPLVNGWSGYFEQLNRNKKSLFLDLKSKPDLNRLYRLVKKADVFVENFSPVVKKKLKIDYNTIRKINPKIIYASVNGISESVNRKYYDVIAQAESGLVSLNGEDGDLKISTSVVDAFSGLKLAFAIAAALFYRLKTGNGQKLSVSMKGSAFDLLEQNLVEYSVTKVNPPKVGNMDNAVFPFGIFKTKDGSIALAVGNNDIWVRLSAFLKKENASFDLSNYSTNVDRIKNYKLLRDYIESIFSNFESSKLVKILNELGIPVGKVNRMQDVYQDDENYSEKLLRKVNIESVGEVVVSNGGISFSSDKSKKYIPAPILKR